jgi:signal transduction histidine kinase
VQLILRVERDNVILEVSDDGVGFDPAASNRQGVGLASMLSRARELGGELEIQSSPGQGARILVRVPAQPPDSSEAETIDTPAAQS